MRTCVQPQSILLDAKNEKKFHFGANFKQVQEDDELGRTKSPNPKIQMPNKTQIPKSNGQTTGND